MSSYFITSPGGGGGGLCDVCLEMGRGMTSILLLFIKMELVHRNSVSRQTVIDIKCRYARVLGVTGFACGGHLTFDTVQGRNVSRLFIVGGPEFDQRASYVRILVDKMALREDYLRVLWSSPISVISLTLRTHL